MATPKNLNLSQYLPGSTDVKVELDPPVTKKERVSKNFSDIINNGYQEALVNSKNNLNLGKSQAFGADMEHHQFERYYNHPKFKQLGFNPYLDNESIYNKASSFTDDFARAYSQWKILTTDSFVNNLPWAGGGMSDVEGADKMERAMAIGTSTRGGAGGFVNNLFLNSGYTFGIMGEILAEELVLAGATFLTGGATSELAVARTAANAARLGKASLSIAEWSKRANKIISALDKMRDVGTARTVYNSLVTGGTNAGKFIAKTAAGETFDFLSNFNKLENLSGVAKTATGFGAMYRDIRSVRLAYGESAIEAGSVENEMIRNLYQDFVDKNGRNPSEEEADKIKSTAKSAALATFQGNMPTIFLSNQIVLGNFTKSFSPLRRLLPIEEGKMFKTIMTKKGFELVEKNFVNAAKSLIKPRTYGALALNYTAANLAEGLQESAQEVIAGANKQYYTNLYNNKTRGGYYDSVATNIAKQFSAEGLEIFASGFLMGGLTSIAGGVASTAKDKITTTFDKSYATKKEALRSALTEKVNTLNEFYKDPTKYTDVKLNNAVEQQDLQTVMAEAEQTGDAKLFQDAKWRSMANQFYTVFETGTEKSFLQRFDELQNLNDEELLQAVSGTDANQIRQNLATMSEKMQEFKNGYDYVKNNLANPFDPSIHKPGSPEQLEEQYNQIAFREAQKDLIFMQEGMKNTMKRMDSIVSEAASDIAVRGVNSSDVVNLFNIKLLSTELSQLNKELAVLSEGDLYTAEAKALKKQKETKIKNLEKFFTSMVSVIGEINENKKDTTQVESGQMHTVKGKEIKASTYNNALNSYKTYIKSLAKGPAMDSNLNKAFDKLLDHYLLEDDTSNMENSINNLINPGSFYEYARRKKQVIETEHKDRKTRIEEALQKYQQVVETNDLLQKLYKNDIFFDPAEWEKLNTEGVMPKRLYFKNAAGNDEILTTSAKYNEAIEMIKEYYDNLGIEISDIQLSYDRLLNQYDTEIRDKLPNDERTYEDIAAQFGFDPKAARTTLPLKDVLDVIIDSEFATEQEQALARRLLMMAKSGETVTFTKELAGPGAYTAEDQTIIDARYSSKEYAQNAQSYPIETSILREEVNRRIYNMQDENPQFNESIQELFDLANEYYVEQFQLGLIDKKPLGLRALDDFVQETLTNESFRDFLHEIPFEATGKSAWAEFVNKVVDTLSVTQGDFSNSALNAVINVVTTNIDSTYSKAQSQTSGRPTTTTEVEQNPRDLSIEEIEATHPELVPELITLYKDYNALFAEIDDISKMPDPDYASKTDEEIKASAEFREYVKNNVSESLRNAFDKYFKKDEVRVISRRPGIKATITETDQAFLFTAQVNQLLKLGYTDEEISTMTPLEGINIIYQGETKEETAARVAKEREDLDQDREAARQEIFDLIDSITNYNEYEANEAEILAKGTPIFWSRTGFKSEEIIELLNNKRQELAYKLEFDDIIEGEYLIYNYLTSNKKILLKVIKKTKNQISLEDETGKVYTFNRKTFKQDNDKRHIFKYNNMIRPEDMSSTPITNEEQTVSNDDVTAIQSLSDEDIAKAITEGENMNEDEAKNDFLDSLDDIC